MRPVATGVWASFERQLDDVRIPAPERPGYRKWVRFYLDFCYKYSHPADSPTSRDPFLAKLASMQVSVLTIDTVLNTKTPTILGPQLARHAPAIPAPLRSVNSEN